MSGSRAGYVPGEGVAVVGTEAVVLLPADIEERLARAVHAALVPGAGVPDVLQVLTGEFSSSLSRIPPFAVAVVSSSGVHAVARGAGEVRVTTRDGIERVSGAGVSTWTERFFAGAESVELVADGDLEPADDASWPLDGGVVRALAVRFTATEPAAAASETGASRAGRSGPGRVVDRPVAAPEVATPVSPALADVPSPESAPSPESVPSPAPKSEPELAPAPEVETDPQPAPEPATQPEPDPEPEPAPEPDPDPEPEPAPEPEPEPHLTSEETVVPSETVIPNDDGDFDHLWGSTVLRPVEAAAVRPVERDADDDPLPSPASPTPSQTPPPAPAPAPVPSESATSAEPAATSEPAKSPEDPPASSADPSGSPAGTAPAQRAKAWVPPFMIDGPPSSSPPAVTADASYPGAESTPSAGPLGDHDGHTVVRGQFAVVAPEPTAPAGHVGRIRLSTGEELDLDRPVVLGRKPRVSRVGGAAVPRLVAVPSPEQDISRSHLEIRPEGVSVLVVDLGSTNGSTLLREGQLPVRLHPNEAVLVVEGDVVDLGEGVTVTFEGLT